MRHNRVFPYSLPRKSVHACIYVRIFIRVKVSRSHKKWHLYEREINEQKTRRRREGKN